MGLPKKAIFAFNANLDHLRSATESDLEKIERHSPKLHSQMTECFSWGVQKEVAIDINDCNFFLKEMEFDKKMVGGQAGNAAEQASALGVSCYLHSNYANEELLSLFAHPENIMVAGEEGFVSADKFSSRAKSAHHFVFENPENRTRFIASYDPFPLHPEDNFCRHIEKELPSIDKAFIGGLHLMQTTSRLNKFLEEMKKWKEINPRLQIFCELGEFQKEEVRDAVRRDFFPFFDMVGMNDTELSSFGAELDELAGETKAILFHSAEQQLVLPEEKMNGASMEFAKRCASFLAKNGRKATQQELVGITPEFIEAPVQTVGLGDTLSCAYFMLL